MENYIIIGLLGVIAISEITRLYLTHRTPGEKEHFKSKLEGTQKMIWDLEFKRFKTREVREDVRREYDNKMQNLAAAQETLKNWPKDGDKAEKARIDDHIVLLERDIERHKAQMDELDIEVAGSKPTKDLPDGHMGIDQQLESLRQVRAMLEDWIEAK